MKRSKPDETARNWVVGTANKTLIPGALVHDPSGLAIHATTVFPQVLAAARSPGAAAFFRKINLPDVDPVRPACWAVR